MPGGSAHSDRLFFAIHHPARIRGMSEARTEFPQISGGLRAGRVGVRRWRWPGRAARCSAPLPCKREQWYLAHALAGDAGIAQADVTLRFLHADALICEQNVALRAIDSHNGHQPLVGWVQAPPHATHVQLVAPGSAAAGPQKRTARLADAPHGSPGAPLERIELCAVAERDPKCHPAANVPRWSVHKPPFPIRSIVLPRSLSVIADLLPGLDVRLLGAPASRRALAAAAIGAAIIIDPAWVSALGLTLAQVEQIASMSYVLLDLKTLADLLTRAGVDGIRYSRWSAPYEIMSARVLYSDHATRGFALQDVFPYAVIEADGKFSTGAIEMNRAWKRYADSCSLVPLLSGETPWEKHSGHIVAAVRAIGRGELLTTDLPWMLGRTHGLPLAPRIARQLLAAHLGADIHDGVQYWNRWDDANLVVRDIVDLARRYAPLRPLRWAPAADGVVRLGVAATNHSATRRLILCSGRIDSVHPHDGVPPEPMQIFMKWLSRELRENTAWARKHLASTEVVWQFDAAAGLKYAQNYEAPPPEAASRAEQFVRLRVVRGTVRAPDTPDALTFTDDLGVFGDGSHEFQARLTRRLMNRIESTANAPP